MTDRDFTRMLAAAELLSAGSALIFTYDRDGWSISNGADVDPFADAPLVEHAVPVVDRSRQRPWADELLKPCGTHSAFNRHRARDEPIDDQCWAAERDYQRDRARRRRARQRLPQSFPQPVYPPVLTTRDGAPMLISVAGQGESGGRNTVMPDPSNGAQNVGAGVDAGAEQINTTSLFNHPPDEEATA